MSDSVNHPAHYNGFSNGAEVIDIAENLSFNLGNAVKYCARAGRKDKDKTIEDLNKAIWYIEREIGRLGQQSQEPVKPLEARVAELEKKVKVIDRNMDVDP
jgi:uncharacterized protein Veg